MVTEYLLLLAMSAMIMALSFGLNKGPMTMFKQKTPVLACLIQTNLETGTPFNTKTKGWQDNSDDNKVSSTDTCS